MIFQQFNLLGNKTVAENILLPLELHSYENTLDLDTILDFVGLTDKKIVTHENFLVDKNNGSALQEV